MSGSAITPFSWTDDDGTGTTGTIINNARLQAIIAAVDALFAGSGSYATLQLGGAFGLDGVAAPSVSAAGAGKLYFDSTALKFRISENGGAFKGIGALELIAASKGTSTNGSAHNLATQALSGLTVLDELDVYYWLKAGAGGGVTYPQLYHTTSSIGLSMMAADASETATSINANDIINGMVRLRCRPDTNTTQYAQRRGHHNTTSKDGNNTITGVTAWTGSWTVGFRVDAASTTTEWGWMIVKRAGQ